MQTRTWPRRQARNHTTIHVHWRWLGMRCGLACATVCAQCSICTYVMLSFSRFHSYSLSICFAAVDWRCSNVAPVSFAHTHTAIQTHSHATTYHTCMHIHTGEWHTTCGGTGEPNHRIALSAISKQCSVVILPCNETDVLTFAHD